jgi:ankyrin repeat protein
MNNHAEDVKELIRLGIAVNEVDKNGRGALFFAAHYGHEEIVSLLLEVGANLHMRDCDGNTPLNASVGEIL